MSQLWVIAYDIENDKNRYNVHEILNDYGERVQFSVFECWLDETSLRVLRSQLQQSVESNDSLRWYPLCRNCRRVIYSQGKTALGEKEQYYLL